MTSKGEGAFTQRYHQGLAIYVMDSMGNLYVSSFQSVGLFHHSSFLAGQPVACAGKLIVKGGQLLYIDVNSGHYQPGQENLRFADATLTIKGVNMSNVKLGFAENHRKADGHWIDPVARKLVFNPGGKYKLGF